MTMKRRGQTRQQDQDRYPERQSSENKTPWYYRRNQRKKTDAVGGVQDENYADIWGWKKKTGPVWRATCTDMAVTGIVLYFRPGR
jgi:hypothetical protein